MNFSTHQGFPFRVFAQFDHKFVRATRQHRNVDFTPSGGVSEQRAFNQFVVECIKSHFFNSQNRRMIVIPEGLVGSNIQIFTNHVPKYDKISTENRNGNARYMRRSHRPIQMSLSPVLMNITECRNNSEIATKSRCCFSNFNLRAPLLVTILPNRECDE